MIPTCYTTKEELALMERQGMALMYDRLRSDDCIALYSEGRVKEMIRAAREEIAKWFDDYPKLVDAAQNDVGGCLICGFSPKLAAEYIRARGDE